MQLKIKVCILEGRPRMVDREAPGVLKDSKNSLSQTPTEPIVVGPAPPITAVEATALEQLKDKIREPGGGIKATPREREVIGLLALGLTDKEAAIRMRISARTVQTHIRHFCKRNGVRNRAEATAFWTGSHCEHVVKHLKGVISEIRESPQNADRPKINLNRVASSQSL